MTVGASTDELVYLGWDFAISYLKADLISYQYYFRKLYNVDIPSRNIIEYTNNALTPQFSSN